jgi:hypothetical protein
MSSSKARNRSRAAMLSKRNTGRLCRVDGCGQEARVTSGDRLCETHRTRKRLHGHELQRAITSKELEPYRVKVRALRKRNPGSRTWEDLRKVWTGYAGVARDVITRAQERRVCNQNELAQAVVVGTAYQEIKADAWIDEVAACVLMWRTEPHKFTNLGMQWLLGKRLLTMTPSRRTFTQKRDKVNPARFKSVKKVHRLTTRAHEILAGQMTKVMATAVLPVALAIERHEARDEADRAAAKKAGEDLK